MVTPGSRVGRLAISLRDHTEGTTRVTITYTFTALTEVGNLFIDDYTKQSFTESMQWLERSMNYFLTTGSMLRR